MEDGEDSLFLYSLELTDQNVTMVREEAMEENPYADASLLCGVLMIVVAVVGLIANVTVVRIFTHRPLVSSINTLLAGLAVTDSALLVSGVPLYCSVAFLSYVPPDSQSAVILGRWVSYATVYLYGWTATFQTASVYVMVLITVERYIAVSHPFTARTMCTWRRALCALIAVSLSSMLYNVSRFWEYELKHNNDTAELEVAQKLRANRDYMNIYGTWSYFIFLFALPFAVLLLLNTLVVITIRHANQFRASLSRRQTKEHATATMMVIVGTGFLACNCLGCVLNAMEVFGLSTEDLAFSTSSETGEADMPVHKPLFYFLIDLSNLLVMVHCSCNFFIYLSFSNRFRDYFCLLSPCCRFRQRRLSDVKNQTLLERDPLSTLSIRHKRRSVPVGGHEAEDGDLHVVPATACTAIAPVAKMDWIPMKAKRHWSFTSGHSSEILICRQYHVVREHATTQ